MEEERGIRFVKSGKYLCLKMFYSLKKGKKTKVVFALLLKQRALKGHTQLYFHFISILWVSKLGNHTLPFRWRERIAPPAARRKSQRWRRWRRWRRATAAAAAVGDEEGGKKATSLAAIEVASSFGNAKFWNETKFKHKNVHVCTKMDHHQRWSTS